MSNNAHRYHVISKKLYDLYYCDDAASDTAIIYCHGGAFRYGDKGDNSDFLTALTEKMSMRVYSVGYRNLDEARSMKNMIDDISKCIDNIAKTDSISHFCLMGASSGAYLVWIFSLMLLNVSMFSVSYDYEIDSVILISGYFLFKQNDPITQSFCLFPTFQGFPDELRNADMDYSDYYLPSTLIISGDSDSCLEDCITFFETIRRTNSTKVELNVFNSDTDKADHCFIIEMPYTKLAEKAFLCIKDFVSD